ncbi:MAG: hypothetical protein P8Z78_02375 [Gammaproteobacteria bacterium]
MKRLEVSWSRSALIWWSIFWRSFLIIYLTGSIIAFVAGFIAGSMGFNAPSEAWLEMAGNVTGFIIAIPAGIWAVKLVLQKEYRNFRIVLAPSTERELEKIIRDRSGE